MGIHDQAAEDDSTEPPDEPESHQPKEKTRRASYLWAMLIARIYEALPLLCPRCGNPMKIVAFITDPASLSRILTIANQVPQKPRHPPGSAHKTPAPPPRTRTPATGFRVRRSGADLAVTFLVGLPECRLRVGPACGVFCRALGCGTHPDKGSGVPGSVQKRLGSTIGGLTKNQRPCYHAILEFRDRGRDRRKGF
jgi:hypothetical protein